MTPQTLEYQLQDPSLKFSVTPVTIPAEAKKTADQLLCEAQVAGMTGQPQEYNEFVAVPGINAVLIEYGQRRVNLPLASDMTVLSVAEVMANNNPEYNSLLSQIVDASRVVCDRYNQRRV